MIGNVPTKPIESVEQYEHYLSKHDWFYEHSDDYSVWRAGVRVHSYLKEACQRFDPEGRIWRLYAPRS